MRDKELNSLLNSSFLLFVTKRFGHINLEQVNGIPHLAGGEDVEDGGEDHSGNGDNGAFLPPAFGDPLVLNLV